MKRFLLIAILLGAIVVALGWWQHRRQLLADRRAAAAQAAAVETALQERIDTAAFAGADQPWGEVLDVLRSRCKVPLRVNAAEAAAMGVDRQTRVIVPEGVFPLDELLDEITGRMDLSWRRAGSRIEITALSIAKTARNKLITRVYPLPAGTAAGGKLTEDTEAMYDLITTSIEPDSWDDVGGDGIIEPAGGALVIRQTAAIHRQIAALFSRMAELPDGPPRQFPVHYLSKADAAAEQALSRVLSVEFRDEKLDSVLTKLATRAAVAIRWGDLPLPERLAAEWKVSYRAAAEVRLESVLTAVLAQVGLTHCVENGGIVITFPDDAPPETWIYDIGDLVAVDGGNDFDTLIDLVMTTVAPDSWDQVGGPGTVCELGDRWLVVVQSRDNQRELHRTLTRIRAHLEPGVDPTGDLPLEPMDDVAPAIHEALEKEVTLTNAKRPLDEVCASLSRQLSIPLIPRRNRLEESAVHIDAPVTCDLPSLPLKHALAILLDEHKLTFDPRGEVLYVTTREDAESEVITRIIDVRHLLDAASGGFDEDSIIDLVETCIEPDSWGDTGGPGTSEIFRGLLVFNQTYDVSRQVQGLIDALSEHCLPLHFGQVNTSADNTRRPAWVGLSDGEQLLIERLEAKVSLQSQDLSIPDAIKELCRGCSVPVHFDRTWHEEASLRHSTFPHVNFPTDLKIDQVPAREAFAAIESRKLAGFTVARGMLMVIDPDYASSHRLMRLYPLRLPKQDDMPQHAYQVADMFTERLEPDTWDENGGYGIIEPVGDEWLLVVQTLPMHRRVEEALAKLSRGEVLPLPMP